MKYFLLKTSLQVLLFFSAVEVFGQDEFRPYRQYATQEVHQRLLIEHPEFSSRLESMENQIKNYGLAVSGKIDTISVVFHILHTPDQVYPSEVALQAQLDALNKDFNDPEPIIPVYALDNVQSLANRAVKPELFFCLSAFDNGTDPVNPFHYVETNIPEWGNKDLIKFDSEGGANARNPEKVLNIWVGYLENGVAGYAQLPGGPTNTDGIVIDARYLLEGSDTTIASVYNRGKTLVHLVGTYLGLYELWNSYEPCKDDNVEDTPIHNVQNFFAGDISYHISLCDTLYQTEMIMNYMDNTDDEALTMFTQGQKNRIKAVLSANGIRSGLAQGAYYCKADGLQVFNDRSNGKKDPDKRPSLHLSPNPAKQAILLLLTAPEPSSVFCTATNTLGAIVWSEEIYLTDSSQTYRVDCSRWSEGPYIISAIFNNGTIVAQKVIIAIP
jgi:hypothetical protein